MSKSRKRQKVEHVSSDEEDDASFAAFSDAEADDLNGHEDLMNMENGEHEDDEDEDEELISSEVDEELASTKQSANKTIAAPNGTNTVRSARALTSGTTVSILSSQVDQLLQQIRPKHTAREVEAEEALHAIKSTIDTIPARGPLLVNDARKALKKEKIMIPFPTPEPAQDSNLKFSYLRPSSTNIVGSYPMKIANRARKFLYIDMVVQMPSELFQEKDYLDFRYFRKRAFYLACIASDLQGSHSKDLDIRFQCHHDDPLRPIITVRPRIAPAAVDITKPTRDWQINILPAIAEDVFSAAKLTPDKNCIRKGRADTSPTPAYNSSIRADMLVIAYLKLLHKASTSCEAYKDACSLGATWLKQRGFRATGRKGGIASFEWSALIALLLTGGGTGGRAVISDRWSSMQIFKATLQFLATKDLVKQPVSIGSGHALGDTSIDLPVVWDAVRGHNIFHKLSLWSFKRLQTEAKITLNMLGDQQSGGFEATFITKKDTDLLDNDIVIELIVRSPPGVTAVNTSELHSKLYSLLRRGLGDRVKSIQLSAKRSKPWPLGSSGSHSTNDNVILIGLLVGPESINRAVDHGPAAEDKAAAEEFRHFWGSKSELRRFKDGSITETLIWESGAGKPAVIEQILRYVLRQHMSVNVEEDITFSTDLQTQMLGARSLEGAQTKSTEAFKSLEQDIRSLEGLPLPIRQVVPAESDLKSTYQSKQSHRVPRDVVMQFESSGRWPDNLAAIQRTKIAFLLMISELLQNSGKQLTCRVGLENPEHDIHNQSFLEVVYDAGAAFRIRIFHDREQTLLERLLKNKSVDGKTVELAATTLATYKREYLRRPAHAQSIAQLCSRHPALRGTIEVLHRWVAQHVLANQFDNEIVELLAARTFVQPWPWQVPNSVQTGFLRTLAWLARWDWRFEALIIDMSSNRELKTADIAAIRTRFEAWRKLDPAFNRVAIFAATNVDSDGTTYTTDRPPKVVVSRLVTLARAALEEIQTQGLKVDFRTLFSSSLVDYDFVLHLDPASVGNKRAAGSAKFKNLELEAAVDATTVGYTPGEDLLEELQTAHGSAMLLFSGLPQRTTIGGVWMPQTADRPWKVNLTYSTKPISTKDAEVIHAQINKQAILAEIARLGGDLIERIELPKRS